MKTNSLASSRKAWRIIQSLISRVVTNGKESLIGGDDVLKLSRSVDSGHPFKVTRSGNVVQFQRGLVSSFSNGAQPSTWAVSDNGGFLVTVYPVWVTLRINTVTNTPYIITNPSESYYVVQAGGQTILPSAEIGDPSAFLGSYSIVGQSVSDSLIAVPIAYLTEDTTHQLLKANISILPQANHHNLFVFS
jgi:hypothetical protein